MAKIILMGSVAVNGIAFSFPVFSAVHLVLFASVICACPSLSIKLRPYQVSYRLLVHLFARAQVPCSISRLLKGIIC
jgi:hypothetical protein